MAMTVYSVTLTWNHVVMPITVAIHRGNWIPPDSEVRLPFVSESGDIVERREHKRVDLRRNNADMPSGIYRCNIPTEAVHDDNKTSLGESVYMGLYASGGIANTLQF